MAQLFRVIITLSFVLTAVALYAGHAPYRPDPNNGDEGNELADRRENQYEYNLYDRTQNKNRQQYYYYQNDNGDYQNKAGSRTNRNYYFNPRTDD